MMKKLLRRSLRKQNVPPPETGGRITNETVAEHREQVLAGGRKFKYPLQYTKHRLLIISVALVMAVLILFSIFCYWQLYVVQSTDRFMYRLTQVVPLPVAKVNGEWVRYSDYLLRLRSSVHYLSTKEAVNFSSDDGKRQLDYQKRLAMDKAIENTLVKHLAVASNLYVSQQEVDDFIKNQILSYKLGVTEDVYRQVIRDYYDWSFDEYKDSVNQQLLRQKVMAKLDDESRQKITNILKRLKAGGDFSAIAKAESEDILTKKQGGDWGLVTKDSQDPSGLIAVAGNLKANELSGVIEGVDGFYIVKLLERRNSGELHVARIFVGYKILDQKLSELRQKNMIQEMLHLNSLQ